MKTEEVREMLYNMVDIVNSYIEIHKLPDCNGCGNRNCGYMPRAGQHVRINCPHFRAWGDHSKENGTST